MLVSSQYRSCFIIFIYFLICNSMQKSNPAYEYPPSHQKALRHRKANQIFKALTPSDTQTCECCGRKIGSSPISASCTMDPDQLAFLGPGIPLFFLYLRMSIILLLSLGLIFSAFAIYSNLVTDDCNTLSACGNRLVSKLSLINKKSNTTYMATQCYLELGFVMIGIGIFQLLRTKGNRLRQQCDQVIDSPSDYAVILRKLPKGTTEKDVEEMLQERRKELTPQEAAITDNLKVVKIVLSYSLRQYLEIHKKNAEEFKKSIKEAQHETFSPQPNPDLSTPSSIGIIVFQHQQSKKYLIHNPTFFQRFLQGLCTPCIPIGNLKVQNTPIGIQRAPEPDDISWQNSGITTSGAICRRALYGSLAVLILLLGGAAQYGLQVLYNSTSDSTIQAFLLVANSLVILIFNSIISMALIFTTKRERTETLAQYQKVLMVKLAIFQFFNAGVFVVASEVLAKNSGFSLNDGICQQITLIMVINCLTPNFSLLFLNYTQIINKILIKVGECGFLIHTQQELNQLYMSPAIDLPSKYAYILKIIWLTGFYAPLVPIVVIISIGGLCLNYLFQKILFTKVYSVPNTVSSMGYETAVQLLQYFLVTFSLGQLISYFYFYSFNISLIPLQYLVPIFIALALAALHFLLPMDSINDWLFPLQESSKSMMKYSEIEEKFQVTYQMTNPAYKSQRERKNVKDILGLGVSEEQGRKIAIQMTNMLNPSLFVQENPISRQPLLQGEVSGRKQGVDNEKNGQKQNDGGFLTALIQSGNTNPNTTEMPNNQNSPKTELKPIKNQITTNDTNIVSPNIRAKAQANSPSTANDTIIKRTPTINNDPNFPKRTQTEDGIGQQNESFIGGDGEKINVSVHEPRELKKSRKGKNMALDVIPDDEDILPKVTNVSNSSTKYKKMPEIPPLAIPPRSQQPPKKEQPSKNSTKEPKLPQPQPVASSLQPNHSIFQNPQKSPFDDAPIAAKAPLPSSHDQSLLIKSGTFNPKTPNKQFYCFDDPQKQKQSIYNPYANFSHQRQLVSRPHLTSEGLTKVLGRPFANFLSKLSVQGMTQRKQKKQKK